MSRVIRVSLCTEGVGDDLHVHAAAVPHELRGHSQGVGVQVGLRPLKSLFAGLVWAVERVLVRPAEPIDRHLS
ncbi:hypothetical protein [Streptomyces phytophilus]|uniref:hypothetical protein n=1 Tax=Streptomyces phytophilus TaxID=722715 RepID=UPI0015EFF3C2|nr:hypothetical protein [Streptomyces phytophilus]